MNDFLLHLSDLLEIKNISRKELSALTGIPVKTIYGWFHKNLVPDAFSSYKVAHALRTSVEYLVTGSTSDGREESRMKARTLAAQIIQVLD